MQKRAKTDEKTPSQEDRARSGERKRTTTLLSPKPSQRTMAPSSPVIRCSTKDIAVALLRAVQDTRRRRYTCASRIQAWVRGHVERSKCSAARRRIDVLREAVAVARSQGLEQIAQSAEEHILAVKRQLSSSVT